MDRFDAETFDYFGNRLYSFVSCEEITDALLRGFSTWSANHGRISFFEMSRECTASGRSAAECELAEVVITGSEIDEPLRVTLESDATPGSSGVAVATPIRRVTLTFDTSSTTCRSRRCRRRPRGSCTSDSGCDPSGLDCVG